MRGLVPTPSAATSLEFIQALYAAPRLNTTEIRLLVRRALLPVAVLPIASVQPGIPAFPVEVTALPSARDCTSRFAPRPRD